MAKKFKSDGRTAAEIEADYGLLERSFRKAVRGMESFIMTGGLTSADPRHKYMADFIFEGVRRDAFNAPTGPGVHTEEEQHAAGRG